MLAAVLTAPGVLEIQDRPTLVPGAGEAVLDVHLAGVCGTDLALYSGDYPVPLPLVLGHEFVGRVASVGAGADPALVGRRATAEINNSCPQNSESPCVACQMGMPTHCLRRTTTGIVAHDGAFAQQICVPVDNLHLLPDGLTDREAVFVEPLAAALQTFDMSPLKPGQTVVVLGAGRLGYLVAGVARARGARVLAVARSQASCDRIERLLEVETLQSGSPDEVVAKVLDWVAIQRGQASSEKMGADHVVEATGSGSSEILALASRLVRPRGTIHLKSTPGAFTPGISLTDLVVNEVRLQGSRCGRFAPAIEFLAKRLFPVAELVSEEYPLAQAALALERARHVSKVVLRCL
ncbi:MAG TPA: alcohol dehydrogenase catalytic domain-containing protein [Candidatus Sumerlaeota bacterium]|nr:alcohol dehydrogenase catalytic domain-containing protein [Candidatus Sumerlaeota bacterium]